MPNLETEPYLLQTGRWPSEGRHILAQYDRESILVYQAYRPSIGHYAAKQGYFGGDFSLSRMTWIKPNFLWMMHRCGWGVKTGQEVVLAIRIYRQAFDQILSAAVPSSYDAALYRSTDEWKQAIQSSEIRLQWDPDHDPQGKSLERRAIQLGLRGQSVKSYARDWIVSIDDISEFVQQQKVFVDSRALENLETPREEVYPLDDNLAGRLGMTV